MTPPIDGEPPWLSLYRAETERFKVIADLFATDVCNEPMANELAAILLDLAGRSSVRDFAPGSARLNRESVA